MQASLVEYRRRASMGSDTFASRVRATKTKIERFEAAPPPERVVDHQVTMRLGGDRTGTRVVICEQLELHGLTDPFDTEVVYGERVAVLGPNGTGKSHFLRLLAGEPVGHDGTWRLGARVVPGYFSQTHDHPELRGIDLLDILMKRGVERGKAMAALRRYGIHGCAQQPFETLSGGQQARLQILLLELAGSTLLLLDEPTDNLDLASAEALEDALEQLRRHRGGRQPRPLVPPRVRPLPGLRSRRHRHRAPGARVRLTGSCAGCCDADPDRPRRPRRAPRPSPPPSTCSTPSTRARPRPPPIASCPSPSVDAMKAADVVPHADARGLGRAGAARRPTSCS